MAVGDVTQGDAIAITVDLTSSTSRFAVGDLDFTDPADKIYYTHEGTGTPAGKIAFRDDSASTVTTISRFFSSTGGQDWPNLATESLEVVDAGSTSATEQDWIEVEVGGNQGYIRVYASK